MSRRGDRTMPAEGTLEEQVRQRYRQPKGVEQFGIEPIPDRLKTVRWFDLFLIVVNFLINPGTILARTNRSASWYA